MTGLLGAAAAALLVSTPVGVAEREHRIALYRTSVPAGEVRFNIRNFGEDTHNLVVLGPPGFGRAVSPNVRAGRRLGFSVTLRRAGDYRIVCTLADHAARGMRARLRVRAARRPAAR